MVGPGLIDAWTQVLERVRRFAGAAADHGCSQESDPRDRGHGERRAPVEPGELEHEVVEGAARGIGQRWEFAELLALAQLGIEVGQHSRHVQLEHGRVRADEAPDIHRRGEQVEITRFQRADMVGLDLGNLGDLINVELLLLARAPELLRDGDHGVHLDGLPVGKKKKAAAT